MARNKVEMLPMQRRLELCDWLMDGTDYEVARQRLEAAGVAGADLPSDLSLRNYMEGEEYQRQYAARLRAYRLENWAPPVLDMETNWAVAAVDTLLANLLDDLNGMDVDFSAKLQLLRTITQRESTDLRRRIWEHREGEDGAGPSRPPVPRAWVPDVAGEAVKVSKSDQKRPNVGSGSLVDLAAAVAAAERELAAVGALPAPGAGAPAFAGSPSAAVRQAARQKRKRRKGKR